MDRYEIYYPESGVVQQKVLISHEHYLLAKGMKEERGKKFLEALTGGEEWFTDKSPLFKAIDSGLLECNGVYLCIIKKLNQNEKI